MLPDIAAPRPSKKHPCFLVAIFPSLYKPGQARQDGGLEARRTIGFEWFFGMILEYAGLYLKTYWRVLNGFSVNNSILSITQTAEHLDQIFVLFRRKVV